MCWKTKEDFIYFAPHNYISSSNQHHPFSVCKATVCCTSLPLTSTAASPRRHPATNTHARHSTPSHSPPPQYFNNHDDVIVLTATPYPLFFLASLSFNRTQKRQQPPRQTEYQAGRLDTRAAPTHQHYLLPQQCNTGVQQ